MTRISLSGDLERSVPERGILQCDGTTKEYRSGARSARTPGGPVSVPGFGHEAPTNDVDRCSGQTFFTFHSAARSSFSAILQFSTMIQ